jgi:PHD/YefM family antitoxin component YafN of YafNO toxin-antitoxin module
MIEFELNSIFEADMHHTQDTYSLTDFKQNSLDHLKRLRMTGRAEVLTVNGKAEAVVMTPEAYDRLMAMAVGDVRDKIAVGLKQARAGELVDGDKALRARRARRNAATSKSRR